MSQDEKNLQEALGLSDRYWGELTERDRALYSLVRPLRTAAYKVDHALSHIEEALDYFEKGAKTHGGAFELDPDFQRGNVWGEAKQIAFVENVFRGCAPTTLRFNSAGWNGSYDRSSGDLRPGDFVCVDGLQRLTAVRRFMAGEIKVFGEETAESMRGTAFDPRRHRLSFEVFSIKRRADLLQFYLDLNRGGVVHSDEEIERVQRLRDEAAAGRWETPADLPKDEGLETDPEGGEAEAAASASADAGEKGAKKRRPRAR
jgi:hypothetical protein